MNSKRRSASWSYPGADKWQREHTAAEGLRSYAYFDALLVGTEVRVLVDKTAETMPAIQNRGQFHGAEAGGGEGSTINLRGPVRVFTPISCALSGETVKDLMEGSERTTMNRRGQRDE